jgi:hypothetical protein
MMRDQRPIYRRPLKMLTRTERIEAGWTAIVSSGITMSRPTIVARCSGCIASV